VKTMQSRVGETNRVFCWEHEGNRAIRKGKWKLVSLKSGRDQWELYDIEVDRTEAHNLAGEHPDVVSDLLAEYNCWATRCGVIDHAQLTTQRVPARSSEH
jgi:arylsulfatase A-like enzyme